jgi:glycosyltransferase involved in cell wall biosynthesis
VTVPRVSFVVPCYRLAHLLPDCIHSIRAQTYENFEVLIMDDCSPDATSEVAQSFGDARVRYIRNEVNVGHLANYNKGIGLARGTYVWLISADDLLRRPYVLERYVRLLDVSPEVGFVFCPVMRFRDGRELAVYGACGDQDAVWKGREFLMGRLLHGNIVPAASGLVRRTCYDRTGLFPPDLPFAGDWYMWSVLALHWKVGYFAEPMVGWRDHELNMTKSFRTRGRLLVADELEVLWRVFNLACQLPDPILVRTARQALADYHAYRVLMKARDVDAVGLTLQECEEMICRRDAPRRVSAMVRATVYAALGDHYYDGGDLGQARACYWRSVRQDASALRTVVKYGLLRLGKSGGRLRARLAPHRHRAGSGSLGAARGTP